MKKSLLILAGLLVLFAALTKARGRISYDKPSPVLNASSMAVMVPAKATHSTKAEAYRFSASIETTPGKGCEANTVLYFLKSYTNTEGLSAGQRQEIVIRKDGATITNTAELPAVTFRTKPGTQISYSVEYMLGGQCKTRPTYRAFPVLEQIGSKSKEKEQP